MKLLFVQFLLIFFPAEFSSGKIFGDIQDGQLHLTNWLRLLLLINRAGKIFNRVALKSATLQINVSLFK